MTRKAAFWGQVCGSAKGPDAFPIFTACAGDVRRLANAEALAAFIGTGPRQWQTGGSVPIFVAGKQGDKLARLAAAVGREIRGTCWHCVVLFPGIAMIDLSSLNPATARGREVALKIRGQA